MRAYQSFNRSITLTGVLRQSGDDPEQVKFQDALMNLRNYAPSESDYKLFLLDFSTPCLKLKSVNSMML
jgi:hypothetical protein